MPKLSEFASASSVWQRQLLSVGSKSLNTAIEVGADFMREAITDSSTGSPWHARKNDANGFDTGARIGNANSSFGDVDPNSGNMLASVGTLNATVSGTQDEAIAFFGWLDATENNNGYYFALQDTGDYKVGRRVGMGLLNEGSGTSSKVLRDYGAQIEAENSLVKTLTAAGLRLVSRTRTGATF